MTQRKVNLTKMFGDRKPIESDVSISAFVTIPNDDETSRGVSVHIGSYCVDMDRAMAKALKDQLETAITKSKPHYMDESGITMSGTNGVQDVSRAGDAYREFDEPTDIALDMWVKCYVTAQRRGLIK